MESLINAQPFTYATPALLFPALSLLMLAYTNRFLALAALIRNLKAAYHDKPNDALRLQIINLRKRTELIKNMQAFGSLSIFFCTLSISALFFQNALISKILFSISLLFMLISLALSLREILISTEALRLALDECEE
ncbi:MAG: DUF2721 domain-containing protein [Chloroherpetonaceae bacterium]|nr:DUF2721 domain-containing protein [Chloroherpetonaceae bacterium]